MLREQVDSDQIHTFNAVHFEAGSNRGHKQAGWFVLNSLLQSSLVPSAESVLTIHTLAMPQ